MRKIKLSFLIVYHSGFEDLKKSLLNITRNTKGTSYEIILVNNGKEIIDARFLNKFKMLRYFKKKNLGYGDGNNYAFKKSCGDYVFIINPDVVIRKETVDNLLSFLDKNKDVSIVAPKIVDESGHGYIQTGYKLLTPLSAIFSISILNKLFPKNLIARNYWKSPFEDNKHVQVEVVPGSAFLVRRDDFQNFDKKIFMYFEEQDLGMKLKKAGKKIYVIPRAVVAHPRKKPNIKLRKYFINSRYYYFRKNFGLLSALVVELICRISKYNIILTVTLLLSIFLRFYRVPQNLVFHGELGENYLKIFEMIKSGKLSLLGPPTSHPWISFGPLFYWIMAPILYTFSFNPPAGAYFFAAVGVTTVLLNYFVVKDLVNLKVALIATIVVSTSPLFLDITRQSRFFSLIIPFVYIFIYYLKRIFILGKKDYLILGLLWGIMLNFHLTPIALIPGLLIYYFVSIDFKNIKNSLNLLLGIVIPSIPFIIYNIKTHFDMVLKLLLWIPYRVAGFSGVVEKNNFNESVLFSNLTSLFNFLVRLISFEERLISFGIIFIFLVYVTKKIIRLIRYKKIFNSDTLILIFFLTTYLAIFIHGEPPIHYYYVLAPFVVIVFSKFIARFVKVFGSFLVGVIFMYLVLINTQYLFSNKWFYQPQDRIVNKLVPYTLQKNVVNYIYKDSQGKEFSLKRVGPFDEFEKNYAQNYIYLLTIKGSKIVDNSETIYTIYEFPPITGDNYVKIGDIYVKKEIQEN